MLPSGARAQDVTVPNAGTITFDGSHSLTTSGAILAGTGAGVTGTVVIANGGVVTMNTTDASTASRIELGNGGTGALVVHEGGSLIFNIANSTPSEAGGAATSIGRIWVGGGLGNTTGGTGTLTMDGGTIKFVPEVPGTKNYGGLAIGRGANVVGTVMQSGDSQVVFQSGGAIDLGTQGGRGTYSLTDNAVLDASNGGMTMYIGSRTSTWTRAGTGGGTPATGELDISGNARFTITTGANTGGLLYVGDAGATGVIDQSGNSVVTLNLANPIAFGINVNADTAGAGTGTYNLSGGTLNVGNAGGSARIIFGDTGTGFFNVSGGTANIDTRLVLANQLNSHGTVDQTGGTVNLNGGLSFGSGTGTYTLDGGTLVVGGTISGSGTFNFGDATLRVGATPLVSGSVANLTGNFIFDTNGSSATWSGVLSGTGSLTKAGAGTLTLSGANTYSGGTEIAAGTLALTGAGTIGGPTAALTMDGGSAVFDISSSTIAAPVVIGSLSGAGTIRTGTNTFVFGGSADTTFSGAIVNDGVGSDAAFGKLAKFGTGTLTLDNVTISGGESYVVQGTLAIGGNTSITYLAVGEGTGNTGSLTIGDGASLTLGTGLVIGDFGGVGTATQTGGTVTVTPLCGDLAHCASFIIGNQGGTGTYTISGGELSIDHTEGTIGRTTGSSPGSTGTLAISDSGLVSVTNGGSIVIGTRQTADHPGSGTINQTGGTLRFDGTSNLYLSGAGGGTYNLDGGTLEIGGISLNAAYNHGTGGYQFNLGGGTIEVVGSNLLAGVNATLMSATVSHLDTNGFNATWSGVLSGTGGLEKDGLGTLVLTGTNTYTGVTTISGGTLQLGAGSTTGSIAGDVVNNGVLAFDRSNPVTFTGAISGNGSVELDGGGMLTFTGTNTYSGGTTISSGRTLQVGNGGATGSIAGNVANEGTLAFNRSGTESFAGAISGGGAVEQNGSGTLIFGGANSYTGGTTISSGTLQLGIDNSLSSAGALAVNGGTFDLNGHDQTVGKLSGGAGSSIALGSGTLSAGDGSNTTVASTISGTGGFVKQGIGTMTLTGANGYSGGTVISAGTLQIGNGVTNGSITGNVANSGVLAFNLSTGQAFGGQISGSGSVEQRGSGTLTLSGDNSYSGGTTVNAGKTLSLLSDTAAGVGAITLGDNATLVFANGLDVANALVIAGTGVNLSVGTGDTATESGNLSGSGSYQITGGGTLNLTGDNSAFTGALILNAGTYNLDSATALGSSTVNVQGAVTFNYTVNGSQFSNAIGLTTGSTLTANVGSGNTATQSGAIGGDGGLVKTGTGILILTGNNNYGGGTTISGGTLQIGDGGTTGGITGNVMNNGVLVVDRSNMAVLDGNISGTGSVIQNGSGVLWLSGNNNYTGDTLLNAGGLMVGSNTALGANTSTLVMAEGTTLGFSGNFTISNNITVSGDPTFNVDAGQTDTINGVISDGATPGDIVKTGAGMLVLTAANTYTGGTTISGGTLALTGNGSIIGSLVDNGTFDISAKTTDASLTTLSGSGRVVLGNRNLALTAAAGTFAGVISGTGGVTISAGQEVFTGNNSYAGDTIIVATATLQLGNGGASGSIAGNVANNGTLIFDRSDSPAYAGVISGAGQIFQRGSGQVTLTGDSSAFAGTTTIQSGVLAVDGALGGVITVTGGGTLAGTGTVAGATISGGTLSPGRSGTVGTLTVINNLTFTSASTYLVDTNSSGNSDLVSVGGSATLNGATMRIGVNGDLRLSNRYTILTATGGVNGTFTISSSFAFLKTDLSYDLNNVYLTLDRSSASFASVATTRNQSAVAGAIERAGGGMLYNAVVQLDVPSAQSAFGQLSGEVHPSTKAVLMDASHFVRNASVDRLRSAGGGAVGTSAAGAVAVGGSSSAACDDWCDAAAQGASAAPATDRTAFWTQAFGSWGQRNSDGNAAALSYSTSGFLVGADTPVFDNWRVGVLSGYSRTALNPGSRSSTGTSDNYDVGLYGGAQWNKLGLRLGATYTWSNIATSRTVAFTGFNDSPSANYLAGTTQLFGELGYRLDVGRTAIGVVAFEPFAGLAFVNVHTNGFTEQGGAAALTANAGDDSLVFQTLGLRGSTTFKLGETDLTAGGSVAWRHAYGDLLPASTVAFAGGGGSFVTAGAPTAHDAAVFEAGFSTAASHSLILSIFYSGEFSDEATAQGFHGNVTWKF